MTGGAEGKRDLGAHVGGVGVDAAGARWTRLSPLAGHQAKAVRAVTGAAFPVASAGGASVSRSPPKTGAAFGEIAVTKGHSRALSIGATVRKAEGAVGKVRAVCTVRAGCTVGTIAGADARPAHRRGTAGVPSAPPAQGRRTRRTTECTLDILNAGPASRAIVPVISAASGAHAIGTEAGTTICVPSTGLVCEGRASGRTDALIPLKETYASLSAIGAPGTASLA